MLWCAISIPGQANGLIHCPVSEGGQGQMPKKQTARVLGMPLQNNLPASHYL